MHAKAIAMEAKAYATSHGVNISRRQMFRVVDRVLAQIESENQRLNETRIETPDDVMRPGYSDPTGEIAVKRVMSAIDQMCEQAA